MSSRDSKPSNDVKPSLDDDNDDKDASSTTPLLLYQRITEGSVEMKFPADQESTVFYNPVQVQNRDLSILMITLWAEERAVRLATTAFKQALKQKQQQAGGEPIENFKQQVQDFCSQLDPATALAEQDTSTDGISILDALAASGLRSIRYWKEIPSVRHITINDLDAAAVERAHDNLQHNKVQEHVIGNGDNNNNGNDNESSSTTQRPQGICVQRGDAIHELYMSRKPAVPDLPTFMRPSWDVIDLDPYGSAAPFLDAAVQAVTNGGLLCVTCTDMAALGGSHPETCYGRYAAMPIQRAPYLQELALRILLQSLATTAAKYGRTITPRLSVGMNFYVRVFVTVHENKGGVSKLSQQIGKLYQSTQCPSYFVVPDSQMGGKKGTVYQAARAPTTCPETGAPFKVGGPLWMGPLHDAQVLETALRRLESTDPNSKPDLKYIATKDRLRGLLQNCAEELPDVPLFYRVMDMASLLKTSSPPLDDVRSALINAGYRVSGYHKDPQAIKTDAPNHVMWDIVRAWCQKQPPKKPPAEGSAAAKILQNPSQLKVDFTRPKQGLKKRTDVARFPLNPEAHWGPKKAATGHKRKAPDSPEKEGKPEAKK